MDGQRLVGQHRSFLKNILVGEVWVCSGQSNMGLGTGQSNNAEQEIAAANYPNIRLFTVAEERPPEPQTDCDGQWKECSPEATGPLLGRGLLLRPPVAQGTERADRPDRHLVGRHAGRVLDQPQGAGSQSRAEAVGPQGESSSLYNGMIAPLIPYAIRGAIWYQGESNVGRAYQYRTLFPAMIANWRAGLGPGRFPLRLRATCPVPLRRRAIRPAGPSCGRPNG